MNLKTNEKSIEIATKVKQMAKTYIDTVKYVVYSSVDIGGLVEKPDVVGAVFGQTEGLLGDELDLRDLQKNGRIGRIEVDLSGREGRTVGEIRIPSSLDMVETCIIAAALETVDRVGPCEARIKVGKIEDTRNSKRKVLVDRAKFLLKNLITTELPESKEISEMVRDEVKTAEVTEYGPEKLSCGPNIQRFSEITLVEGRADVINLLKNDVPNCIAIGGAKVPETVVRLSKEREVTVFLDGDRGGDIILNELVQGGVEIDFVARAPTGKEVEELTRKELIKCLRGRVPFEQGMNERALRGDRGGTPAPERRRERRDFRDQNDTPSREPGREQREMRESPPRENREAAIRESRDVFVPPRPFAPPAVQEAHTGIIPPMVRVAPVTGAAPVGEPLAVDPHNLMAELEQLNNTLRARFYNAGFEKVKEMPVRDVIKALEETADVRAVVFDGIITQRLVDLAATRGVKRIVGVKKGNVNKTPEGVEIFTKMK